MAHVAMTRPDFNLCTESEVLQRFRKGIQEELSVHRSMVLAFAKMFMSLASQAQQGSKDRALMPGISLGTRCDLKLVSTPGASRGIKLGTLVYSTS